MAAKLTKKTFKSTPWCKYSSPIAIVVFKIFLFLYSWYLNFLSHFYFHESSARNLLSDFHFHDFFFKFNGKFPPATDFELKNWLDYDFSMLTPQLYRKMNWKSQERDRILIKGLDEFNHPVEEYTENTYKNGHPSRISDCSKRIAR